MNILHMLGLDTGAVYGCILLALSLFCAVFPYVFWKKTAAWKKNKGEKTKFTEIWKPGTVFSCILFAILGVAFLLIYKYLGE